MVDIKKTGPIIVDGVDYTEYSSEYIDDMIDDIAGMFVPTPGDAKTIVCEFPLEQKDRYGTCIVFRLKSVRGASVDGSSHLENLLKGYSPEMSALRKESTNLNERLTLGKGTDKDRKRIKEIKKEVTALRQEEVKKETEAEIKYTERTVDYRGINIKLYLPISLQQNDTFNIATPELGQLGASMEGIMSGGKGVFGALGGAIDKGFSSIIDLVTGQLAGDAARLGSAQLAGKIPVVGSEIGQAAQISGAVAVNPNVRSAFRGVALREFSFTFKFIARSQKEAEQVEKIIKYFRVYSYPESIEAGGISAGYRYPDMFEIDVRHEPTKKRVGTKIQDCFLRSISTNYNPSSMSFHSDGRPVEIDLSLNFIEERTLSRKNIDLMDGY
jgi:hypothetical protein